MSAHSILAHKKMALDTNVWLVLLVTILLCLGLIAYKVIDNKSCTPFAISVRSVTDDGDGVYETDETLIFRTSLPEAKEITWQFGDNTEKERSVSVNMRHKFMKQGLFTVTASLNGTCSNEIRVNIKKSGNPLLAPENTNNKLPKIYGNMTPLAGKAERYVSDAIGNAYEWKVLDKASFPAITEQYAVFTFQKPGIYVLQLTVDHDRKKRSQIEINVSEDLAARKSKIDKPGVLIPFDIRPPKPKEKAEEKQPDKPAETPVEKSNNGAAEKPATAPAETPPARKVLFIHNQIFQTLLEGVVSKQKDVEDFDPYLIDGGATKVLANNGNNYKSFRQLCQEIRGKKIVIESVDLKRDEADKTRVMQILVKYKKKWF